MNSTPKNRQAALSALEYVQRVLLGFENTCTKNLPEKGRSKTNAMKKLEDGQRIFGTIEKVLQEHLKQAQSTDALREESRQFGIKQCVDFLMMRAANNWHGNPSVQKIRDHENEFIDDLVDEMLNLAPDHSYTWTTLQQKNKEIAVLEDKLKALEPAGKEDADA